MPKTKKETMKDKKPCTSKKTATKKLKKPAFKFNINEIIKKRRLEGKLLEQTSKLGTKLDEEMKVVDELYPEQLSPTTDLNEDNDKLPLVSTHFDPDDFSNYNIPFKDDSDSDLSKLCIQRLYLMSIERNEIEANIHFNHLMKANWSPVFDVCFKNNKFYSLYLFNK